MLKIQRIPDRIGQSTSRLVGWGDKVQARLPVPVLLAGLLEQQHMSLFLVSIEGMYFVQNLV